MKSFTKKNLDKWIDKKKKNKNTGIQIRFFQNSLKSHFTSAYIFHKNGDLFIHYLQWELYKI